MNLDIRIPTGLLFGIIGLILAAHGLLAGKLVFAINVNLWWGLALVVFALVMLGLAWRAAGGGKGGGQ